MTVILRLVCFVALLGLATTAFAQEKRAALLLVEFEEVNHIAEIQHLVRYNFRNGELVSRDPILTSREVRFDLSNSRVLQNRYLITDFGDVVDIDTRVLVHKGEGEFVAVDGNRVIERVDQTRLHGYFYYDTRTGASGRLRAPGKWGLPGVLSPDHKKSVVEDRGKIWLHYLSGKKRILASGFSVGLSAEASEFGKLPLLWLDNNSILTQRSNGKIIRLGLDGSVKPIVDISISEAPYRSPEFEIDDDGKVIYDCFDSYVVDVAGHRYFPYERLSLGHGFYVQEGEGSAKSIFYFASQEIGRWRRAPGLTGEGLLAVEYDPGKFQFSHPSGVKVWSNDSKRWTGIDVAWLAKIVGWIRG